MSIKTSFTKRLIFFTQYTTYDFQRTIDGWYLLQIFTSIPFTNYSLYVS
jgi:hypothetical protein